MPKQNELYLSKRNKRVFFIEAVLPKSEEVYTRTIGTGRFRILTFSAFKDPRMIKLSDNYQH